MEKKRILWVSEASFLATGFSVLTHEILSRLYSTDKYEIAELGSYAKSSDPRSLYVPWKFYGAIPEDNEEFYINLYNNSQLGQFGESMFEKACLDFQPDIVVDVRDWWMAEWQLRSPFRPYYKLVWMPTVDGEPQRLEWLDSYSRADLILTYSKYGKNVLEREAPGRIRVFDVVSTGANHEMFKPIDKQKARQALGIKQDINLVMTVMRNQRRKLFPDLIEAFSAFLKKCDNEGEYELAQKTYLYLHTSYPDVGFDFPRYLMQCGVGHKVYVTYMCENCNTYYADFFHGELAVCSKCGGLSAHLPNTNNGLPREEIPKILNAADLYVQYSICEGFGMPIAEAKSCGIPALGVDYSATSEQVNVPGCQPIKVAKFFHESVLETEQKRALPDTEDAVDKIYTFFKTDIKERERYSGLVREDVVKNHSFDRSAKIFEKALDSVVIIDRKKTWDNTDRNILLENKDVPQGSSNTDFVDWCIDNLIQKPELKATYWRSETIKALNTGFRVARGGKMQFNKEVALKEFQEIVTVHNFWERQRIDKLGLNTQERVKWRMI
jgi:glycosyltransferase involved in cell wall biosynthesis